MTTTKHDGILKGASRIVLASIILATPAVLATGPKTPCPCKCGSTFRKLIDQHIKCVVTVKYVMKLQMGSRTQELEAEAPGLMIRTDGLVLAADTTLGGMLKSFGISGEPQELKVLVGAEEDEYDAKLLARDTDLDLAWIRIENEDNVKFDVMDFSDSVTPKLGQMLTGLRRMSKFFDRAPMAEKGIVCCITEKPRKLYVPGGDLSGSIGSPVFTAVGEPVGFAVRQIPTDQDLRQAMFMGQLSMGTMQDNFGGKILPAKQIVKATKRALQQAKVEKQQKPTTTQTTQPTEKSKETKAD